MPTRSRPRTSANNEQRISSWGVRGARILLGALCGAALTLASPQSSSWLLGAVLGAVGGIAGAFAAYQARTRLVRALNVPDIVIALAEDAVAIAAAILIVTHV